jgi:hypothetical protein
MRTRVLVLKISYGIPHTCPAFESATLVLILKYDMNRIAADEGRFKNNNEVIINTETR